MTNYVLREVPVGLRASGTRRERDALGTIDVPADRYWGANTQRAFKACPVSADGLPEHFFRCYGYIKRAAAMMNTQAGRLPSWKTAAIARAADDLIAGHFADQFPLSIWQCGCGRDADTNVNEVLANRAGQLLGAAVGNRGPVDPVMDVNMGQSLGGTFTASMYIATVIEIEQTLVPRCSNLARALERNPSQSLDHSRRLRLALGRLDEAEGSLHEIGADFGDEGMSPCMTEADWQVVIGIIVADTARPFIVAPDGFSDRGSVDAMVAAMAAVRGLAITLLDIADAIHRCSNVEARVNRSQTDAVTMACQYVVGQDQMVVAGVSQGRISGMARPLLVSSVLKSIQRLAEVCEALRQRVL